LVHLPTSLAQYASTFPQHQGSPNGWLRRDTQAGTIGALSLRSASMTGRFSFKCASSDWK
jgi:hypothetical protein